MAAKQFSKAAGSSSAAKPRRRPKVTDDIEAIWQDTFSDEGITTAQFMRVAEWAYSVMSAENRALATFDLFQHAIVPERRARHET